MRDADVRRALLADLEARHDPSDTLVVNEFGICNGESRVDVAVVNGELIGYEIKSAVDRLDRLPGQCEMYGRVLDKVTLVVAEDHLDEAAELIPDWWGIVRAAGDRTEVSLASVRCETRNPNPDTFSLARLLWRDEALNVLKRYELADGVRSKPRRHLWRRLAEQLDHATLAAAVRDAIKVRNGWRDSS